MPGNRLAPRLSASALTVLCAYDVEEVCQFDYDVTEVRLSEKVFLRITVYVSQSVIIAGLQLEVSNLRVGILKSEAGSYSVVTLKFVLVLSPRQKPICGPAWKKN